MIKYIAEAAVRRVLTIKLEAYSIASNSISERVVDPCAGTYATSRPSANPIDTNTIYGRMHSLQHCRKTWRGQ